MTTTKLGRTQSAVLRRLAQKRDSGIWYPGCGWIWDNVSRTVRIMESLERRDLVDAIPGTGGRPTQYRLNEAGRAWVDHHDPVQQIARAVAERSAAAETR
ncbi:hypothetical protein ACNQVK_03105 [Mycobacterium sp. 134]|uniref:hypothetical protein n=1 Tax=Mycobacterium sp. 134 TaxID=3400425 RepID=UPI003AAB2153